VIHFLGPPGTGKTHLASALAIEAVKVGRSVYHFSTLTDIVVSSRTVLRSASNGFSIRFRLIGRRA
jgi:replication-associated recombination protein RarA